jgi:antitoxin component of MazEF toxin-antitoxin module
MSSAHIKKVLKIGGSLAIILPNKWVKLANVKAGQEMIVVGNGELRIFPAHIEDVQITKGK